MNKHKVTTSAAVLELEMEQQQRRRALRVREFFDFLDGLGDDQEDLRGTLLAAAAEMHLEEGRSGGHMNLHSVVGPVLTRRAPERDKRIRYDAAALPKLDA